MDEVMRILNFQELKLLLIILTKKRYKNPIRRTMAINQKSYFKLNKENTKDGRDHYFYFKGMKEKQSLVRYLKDIKHKF